MEYETFDSAFEPGQEEGQVFLGSISKPQMGLLDLLNDVLRHTLRLSASDSAAGMLVLPGGLPGSDVPAAAVSRSPSRHSQDRVHRWAAALWTSQHLSKLHEPVRLDDLTGDRESLLLRAESRSALLLPLAEGRCSLGFLSVESSQPRHYSELDIERLRSLASAAIPAIYRLMLREHLRACGSEMDLIGMSRPLRSLERQILDAARYDRVPVLITGERGSGKELAAWAVHVWSSRRPLPFVPVLISGLPDALVTDELFGHERNSFTGAEDRRPGKFEAASGGTVFLDEIGDINPGMQAALLRIVERNELSRIGRDLPVRVKARVVAATNRDLCRAAREGAFREDLYDRLMVFEIKIPPLRERREDIPLLADHFLSLYCSELQRRAEIARLDVCRLCRSPLRIGCASPDFYEALAAYDWPGNIRELKHVIFRVATTVRGEVLRARHLPDTVRQASASRSQKGADSWNLDAAVRRHIEAVLEVTGQNKSQAARLLGIPYTTLQSKLKKLGYAATNGNANGKHPGGKGGSGSPARSFSAASR